MHTRGDMISPFLDTIREPFTDRGIAYQDQ